MLNAIKDLIRPLVKPPLHRPDVKLPHELLGTEYGRWPLLRRDRKGPVLSFGIGEDISWDLAVIARGHTVHAFDPTPKSTAWIARQNLPEGFIHHEWGLSDRDGSIEIYAPANPAHTSYSATRGPDQAETVTSVPAYRLVTILEKLGLSECDTLKMDIEGFEYGVIDDMIATGALPHELMIEFHHRMYDYADGATLDAVERLKAAGYRIFHVSPSGHEYGFVRQ